MCVCVRVCARVRGCVHVCVPFFVFASEAPSARVCAYVRVCARVYVLARTYDRTYGYPNL